MSKNKLIEFASAGLPRSNVKLSDGRKIKLRAFAVKELKLLMMSFTAESAQDVQILQILDQCIETDGIDASKLPSVDVELLYLELYKLSKGTTQIPVQYRCVCETDEGKECGAAIKTNINLNNVVRIGGSDTTITLSNGLKLMMRYPTILECEYFEDVKEEYKYAFNMAIRCIESIDTGSEVMTVGTDVTVEEVSEVIEYLDENSFAELMSFVRNVPTIGMSFPIKCPSCGHEETVELRGLADFFE